MARSSVDPFAVDRSAAEHGCEPVAVDFVFPEIEKNADVCFHAISLLDD